MANVNNYIAAGQASVRKNLTARKALSDNKPDYGALGEVSIRADRDLKIARVQAAAKVKSAQIKAESFVKEADITADTNKTITNANRTIRKAGVLAAGVKSLAAANYLDNKKNEPNEQLPLIQQQIAKYNQRKTDAAAEVEQIKNEKYTPPKSLSGTGSTDTTKADQTTPASTKTVKSGSSSNTSGTVDPAEVYSYLTNDKGLSKNKALGLMANIERESSFRINPAGGDNGNSFGMLQWNNTYDRSDLMKQNVPDWQTNWKGQLDHALSQNQLPEYNKASSTYLNTTWESPQAAADYFMNTWEKPADPFTGSKKHAGFISGYNF